jgi:holo-[acyl-carrier protein] synthase
MMVLRTGIDILEIERLSTLSLSIRDRFLNRVFTPREIAEAQGNWETLAGRFAVKEAVAKALGTGIGAVGWKSIEIQRGANGEPILKLVEKAAEEAQAQGLQTWSVSISHSKGLAVAVVVATGEKR